jgi:hypothetical protein
LLHAITAWLIFNIGDWLLHSYNVQFGLAYTVNNDGAPVSAADRFINNNINQPLVLWVLLLAFLAEINYQFVFKSRGLLWFTGGCFVSGLAGSFISILFQKQSIYVPVPAYLIEVGAGIIAYIAGYAILFNFIYERYNRAKLNLKKSESELHLLKAQINPHFFFNTLNNVYGMALNEHATQTAEAIELLATMMRYNLEGNTEDFIELPKEIKFIENYLSLQQLRVSQRGNIAINTKIECADSAALIAPMLLIPFIENAWKYGISMDNPCFINLNISVVANQLTFYLENSVLTNQSKNKGSGLGVSNVQQRLALIYPDQYKLTIQSDKKKYCVDLIISL